MNVGYFWRVLPTHRNELQHYVQKAHWKRQRELKLVFNLFHAFKEVQKLNARLHLNPFWVRLSLRRALKKTTLYAKK